MTKMHPINPAIFNDNLSLNNPLMYPPRMLPNPKKIRDIATLVSLFSPSIGFGSKWDRELATNPAISPAIIEKGRRNTTFLK